MRQISAEPLPFFEKDDILTTGRCPNPERAAAGKAEKGVKKMADKELEITTNTYIFAGVGALILGGIGSFALGGMANTISAGVVGALAGGCLGLFF